MVTVALFWATILGLFLYLLCAMFKTIYSFVQGSITAIMETLVIGTIGFMVILVLLLLEGIVSSIMAGVFWDVLWKGILICLLLLFLIGLIGGLGAIIIEIAMAVVYFILTVIVKILEIAIMISEKGYIHFMNVIIRQIDK